MRDIDFTSLSPVEGFVISQYKLSTLVDTVMESTLDLLLKTVTMGTGIYEETYSLAHKKLGFHFVVFFGLAAWYLLPV